MVKGYLLDTNIALAATLVPEELSPRIMRAVETGPSYISIISYWEVMLKSMRGNLDVGNPQMWWDTAVDSLSLRSLAFRAEHVTELRHMPPLHKDPFDRALLSVARAENLAFLTMDKQLSRYADDRLSVIL